MEPTAVAQWSALPRDILTTIANLLDSNIYLLLLRSVCSSWRSSLPLTLYPSLQFPLKVPPPTTPFYDLNPTTPGHFAVVQTTVLRLSSLSSPSLSWLLKISRSTTNPYPNTLSLLNPLSLENFKHFSSHFHINLLDYRISDITKSYHLKFFERDSKNEKSPIYIRKVVVVPGYGVLLLSYGGRLERWRFGDENWVPVVDNENEHGWYYHFSDFICFDNQRYGVNVTGVLVRFDLDFNPVDVTCSLGYSPRDQKCLYLVSSDGDMYLVIKTSHPDPEFYYDYFEDEYVLNEETFGMPLRIRVFKLNSKQGDWDFVGSLGEKVFFLGDDVSFSISARDFDGCRGNCIYLTDECFCQDDEDNVYGQDSGLYALDEHLVVGLAGAPEYAKVFWPPPRWLVSGSSSSGS